jgi:hypothetical protein
MEYIGALILIILSAITLIAFFLAVSLLFPRRVGLSQQAASEMPGRSFVLGLINTLFFTALIFGFMALADRTGAQFLYLPALLLLVFYLIGLSYGLSALVQMTGVRLLPDASPNRQRILGALTLILGCLTPFIGWFGLFVYLCLLGFGGFVLGYFKKPNTLISPKTE